MQNLSWSDYWGILNAIPESQQRAFWHSNFDTVEEWITFIRGRSPEGQLEILRDAPRELIQAVESVVSQRIRHSLHLHR